MKINYTLFLILLSFMIIVTSLLYGMYLLYLDNNIDLAKRKIEIIKKDNIENKVTIDETFNGISKIYINMEKSIDREKNMQKEISQYGIKNIQRFPAIDGIEFEDTYRGKFIHLGNKYYYNNLEESNPKDLAITLSHLLALREGLKLGEKYFIIMEDDIEFTLTSRWEKDLGELLSRLPPDFHYLTMCYNTSSNTNKPRIKKYIGKKEGLNGMCNLYSREGARKILDKYLKGDKFYFYENVKWGGNILKNFDGYYISKSLFLPYNFPQEEYLTFTKNGIEEKAIKEINRDNYYNYYMDTSIDILKKYKIWD